MKDFDRRVVPAAGLDEVVVEESIMKQLKQIVQFEKARSVTSSKPVHSIAAVILLQICTVWPVGICQAQPQGSHGPSPRQSRDRQDSGCRGHWLRSGQSSEGGQLWGAPQQVGRGQFQKHRRNIPRGSAPGCHIGL